MAYSAIVVTPLIVLAGLAAVFATTVRTIRRLERERYGLVSHHDAERARLRDFGASVVQFKHLVQSVVDYGISILDEQGMIVSWNDGAATMMGYQAEEIIGQPFTRLYPPDMAGRDVPREIIEHARETTCFQESAWHVRKDGRRFFASIVINAIRDEGGRITGFVKFTRDITDWKNSQDQLEERVSHRTLELSQANQALQTSVAELRDSREQLRRFSKRLHTLQETERARIGRELHDELGQMLAVMKIELQQLNRRIVSHPAATKNAVQHLIGTVDQTVLMLRRISTDLRPIVLEQLGLAAALEWFTGDLIKRTGLRCNLEVDVDFSQASHEVCTGLFRITQEAVTNALKYSGTDQIDIEVSQRPGRITMTIRDYGQGMALDAQRQSTSLGLIGMRERALEMDGTLTIDSTEQGTAIIVDIPWPQNLEVVA